MRVEITAETINPWQWLAKCESEMIENKALKAAGFGATTSFVGTMRDFNQTLQVSEMALSHYPGMTEKQLDLILDECLLKHSVITASLIHRIGTVRPADTLVVVAVWSEHRKAAFEACRYIMEALKHHAPFWKKELTENGTRWVEKNTKG